MGSRILVVDDNRTNMELMCYLLRAFGHECDSATDGDGALEKARGAAYDLALLDILMPAMDGYELARRFKADAHLAEVPLVAVTALAMPGDRDRIMKAGFDGYITKPIDPQRFVQQIEKYLRAPKPEARGPVVLAVDDVQQNLDVIRTSLAPFGYRIVEARSTHEALDFMERTPPALVICDFHMPGEGGIGLLEHIREHETWRVIPFIFLSSTAWKTKDRRLGMEHGARKFILRPIEPARLRKEVEELIGRGDDPDR